MYVDTKKTTTITLTLTADEAARIMRDFDERREPSIPGKALYSALVKARGETSADPVVEAFRRGGSEPIRPVDPEPCQVPECPYTAQACPAHCSSCGRDVDLVPGCQKGSDGKPAHTRYGGVAQANTGPDLR